MGEASVLETLDIANVLERRYSREVEVVLLLEVDRGEIPSLAVKGIVQLVQTRCPMLQLKAFVRIVDDLVRAVTFLLAVNTASNNRASSWNYTSALHLPQLRRPIPSPLLHVDVIVCEPKTKSLLVSAL